MSRPVKGPWFSRRRRDGGFDVSADSALIARVAPGPEETDALARAELVAAAPELLEALEELLALTDDVLAEGSPQDGEGAEMAEGDWDPAGPDHPARAVDAWMGMGGALRHRRALIKARFAVARARARFASAAIPRAHAWR